MDAPRAIARPSVEGKFLFLAGAKLHVRGVTYGTFSPDAYGNEFPPASKLWSATSRRWRRLD